MITAWRIWRCELHMEAGKSPYWVQKYFLLPAIAHREAGFSVCPTECRLSHSTGSSHSTKQVLTGSGISGSHRLAGPPLQHSCAPRSLSAPTLAALLSSARGWKTVYLFMDSPRLGSGFVSVNREEIQSVNGGC